MLRWQRGISADPFDVEKADSPSWQCHRIRFHLLCRQIRRSHHSAVESDVNAFWEVNGKFFQQGAAGYNCAPAPAMSLPSAALGEVVSAESRQTYRVLVASADFVARIGKRSPSAQWSTSAPKASPR